MVRLLLYSPFYIFRYSESYSYICLEFGERELLERKKKKSQRKTEQAHTLYRKKISCKVKQLESKVTWPKYLPLSIFFPSHVENCRFYLKY